MLGARGLSSAMNVIGIDCAAQASNVGLALGRFDRSGGRLVRVASGQTWEEIIEIVAGWSEGATLLAIDAPLGWPRDLGPVLAVHRAGDPIAEDANQLFRRETDDAVHRLLGKRPLDVGADRIARTALAALRLLQALRARTGNPVPLATSPDAFVGIRAIEVYPAATLRARGVPETGYKGPKAPSQARRREILEALQEELSWPDEVARRCLASDHTLDAILSVLAGFDFLEGDCVPPPDLDRAIREGWIWVRPPR